MANRRTKSYMICEGCDKRVEWEVTEKRPAGWGQLKNFGLHCPSCIVAAAIRYPQDHRIQTAALLSQMAIDRQS